MPSVSVALDNRGGERLLVNKRELARQILNCSLPTLNDLIDRYPDFPVETRGSNGIEWQFDAHAVVEFLQGKREADQRDSAARAELFRQFTLPIDDVAGEEAKSLAPSQRLALARTRIVENKLAREAGLLVPTSEVRQNLAPALTRLMRFVDGLPRAIGSRFNLPEEVVAAMRNQLDDQRRELVAELDRAFEADAA